MTIGNRNKPCNLERNETIASDFSYVADAWTAYHECWAEIKPSAGTETQTADQVEAIVSHVIEIDYPFIDVLPTDRVNYEGRIFNVSAVLNVNEADEVLRLLVSEESTDGSS